MFKSLWLHWLCLWLLASSSSVGYVRALEVNVASAAELHQALLDPGVGVVRISAANNKPGITLDPAAFQPINISHAVAITSASSHAVLDFGNAQRPLITVAARGNLTLQDLTISGFYPAAPLPYTTATAVMPLSAISISSDSASLAIVRCILLVEGSVSKLTTTMPYWQAASQQGRLEGSSSSYPATATAAAVDNDTAAQAGERSLVSSAAAPQPRRIIELPSTQLTLYGGNSRLIMADVIIALDAAGCYNGFTALAWDSASLYAALQGTNSGAGDSTQVLLFADAVLQTQQFCPLHSEPIGNITLRTCSSSPSSLNFNRLPQAITLKQGATMQMLGALQLAGAAGLVGAAAGSDISSSALLLLGSVDVTAGAQLLLQDVTVAVPDSTQVEQAMQQLAGSNSAGTASTSLSLAPLPAASGQNSTGFLVRSWSVGLEGLDLGGVRAAAGARLTLQNVQVVQAAAACFPSARGVAVADDDGLLHHYLLDDSISMIQITSNIKLLARHWQPTDAEDALEVRKSVEIRGCHPDGERGGSYVIDFSELQGSIVANIYGKIRFSGDLVLRAVADRPDVPGSWPLVPILNLVDKGSVEFQGVVIQGRTKSILQDTGSAFWNSLPPSMTGSASSNDDLLPTADISRLLLPVSAAADLFPSMFSSTQANSRSSYGYIRTQLQLDSSLPAPPASAHGDYMPAASIAAVVLGAVLGVVLLALLLGLLVVRHRQRQQGRTQPGRAGKHFLSWTSCWPKASGSLGLDPRTAESERSRDAAALHAAAAAERGEGMFTGTDDELLLRSFVAAAGGSANVNGLWNELQRLRSAVSTTGGIGSGQLFSAGSVGHRLPGDSDAYGRQISGNCDVDSRKNSSRVQHHGLFGHTTEGHTTQTDEGSQAIALEGGMVRGGQHKQQVFEDARRRLGATAGDLARSDALVLESVLGEGTFGKVFKGYWKGTLVAVKTMMFPAAMSGKEKREKMAIMETAISASLSHPNIVQMYTYYLRPVLVGHEAQLSNPAGANDAHRLDSSSVGDSTMNAAFLNEGLADSVHSWEVQLVLEYCDKGSLRHLLNKKGPFTLQDGSRDMLLILDTALDVARAMVHLHSENIIHSDLKARNILLKSSGGADGRQFVAKVADFGLSMRIDPTATHVSNVYQGTMTHMAPEVMLQGKLSRGSDVYAFGVLLWELYSGGHAFKGVPRALLGHEVAHKQRRPEFPEGCPFEFQLLACRCWESDVSIRPSFQDILAELQRMRERMAASAASSSVHTSAEPIAIASAVLPALAAAAGAGASGIGGQQPMVQGIAGPGLSRSDRQQPPESAAFAAAAAPVGQTAVTQHVPSVAGAAAEASPHGMLQQQVSSLHQQAHAGIIASTPTSSGSRHVVRSAGDVQAADQPQAQEHVSQQQQPGISSPQSVGTAGATTSGPSALSVGPLQAMAAAAMQATGSVAVSAAGRAVHANLDQQQQQHALSQDSKDSIPEHLLQQMSMTVSEGDAWLAELGSGNLRAGEAPVAMNGAHAAAAKAGSSPAVASHAGSSASGEKSTYVHDLTSSTLDRAPHCFVYGARPSATSGYWHRTDGTPDSTPPASSVSQPEAAAVTGSPQEPVQPALKTGREPSAAVAADTTQAAASCGAQASVASAAATQPQHETGQIAGAGLQQSWAQDKPEANISSAAAAGTQFARSASQRNPLFAEAVQSAPTNSSSRAAAPASHARIVQISDVFPASPSVEAAAAAANTSSAVLSAVVHTGTNAPGTAQEQQEQKHLPLVQQLQRQLVHQQTAPAVAAKQQVQLQSVSPESGLEALQEQQQCEQTPSDGTPEHHAVQEGAGLATPIQQQQQITVPNRVMAAQQDPEHGQQRLAAVESGSESPDSRTHEDTSSSSDYVPLSGSWISSTSRPQAQSGSVAALQAVMSLKASLAKRAISGAALQRPATASAQAAGQQVATAQDSQSGPLPSRGVDACISRALEHRPNSQPLPALPPAGFSNRRLPLPLSAFAAASAAAGRARSSAGGVPGVGYEGRFSLDAQQAAAAAAGAWPAGVETVRRCSLDTRLGSGQRPLPYGAAAQNPAAGLGSGYQASAETTAWHPLDSRTVVGGGMVNTAGTATAPAAAGRFSFDARAAATAQTAQFTPALRTTGRALSGHFDQVSGRQYAGNAAVVEQVFDLPNARSPPISPSARFHATHHAAVRKAVSASQLNYNTAAGIAVIPQPWPARLSSEPLGCVRPHTQQHISLPEMLQHAASVSSTTDAARLDELSGLDPSQLQLLAQIADAAKAQVSLPVRGLAKPTQSLSQPGSVVLSGLSSPSSSGAPSGQLPQQLARTPSFSPLGQVDAAIDSPACQGGLQVRDTMPGCRQKSFAASNNSVYSDGGQGTKPRRASAPPQQLQPQQQKLTQVQPAAAIAEATDGRMAKARRASAPVQKSVPKGL